MSEPSAFGFSGAAVEVAHEVRAQWEAVGLLGGFHARNIDTGEELGFAADTAYPLASVAKLPLALVVLDRIARGELAADHPVELRPDDRTSGPTGVSSFAHPARIAVEDLVRMMLAVSDNAAADALFALVPPREVNDALVGWGCDGIAVRHPMRTLHDSIRAVAPDDPEVRLELAIRSTTRGGGHVIPALDVAVASAGTARGLVTLLCRVWTDDVGDPSATARLRELLRLQVARDRMAHALASDAVQVASKTGTFFNLRHEAGVVSTSTGDRIALAALTASTVPALLQPDADRSIGRAARAAVDVLRL